MPPVLYQYCKPNNTARFRVSIIPPPSPVVHVRFLARPCFPPQSLMRRAPDVCAKLFGSHHGWYGLIRSNRPITNVGSVVWLIPLHYAVKADLCPWAFPSQLARPSPGGIGRPKLRQPCCKTKHAVLRARWLSIVVQLVRHPRCVYPRSRCLRTPAGPCSSNRALCVLCCVMLCYAKLFSVLCCAVLCWACVLTAKQGRGGVFPADGIVGVSVVPRHVLAPGTGHLRGLASLACKR